MLKEAIGTGATVDLAKADAIAQLGISADSDFEIEAIRSMLPDVTPILYERDSIYEALSCFNLKRGIDAAAVKQRHDA